MRQSAFAATAVVLALSVVGCGGSKSSSASVLGARFTAKAAGLCSLALKEKRAEPNFPFASFNPTKLDVAKLQAIGRYERRGVQIFTRWNTRMTALATPRHGAEKWAALLKALHDHTRIISDQQAAAARRDGARFTHDYYAGNNAQSAMTTAAKAAGVPICATAAGA